MFIYAFFQSALTGKLYVSLVVLDLENTEVMRIFLQRKTQWIDVALIQRHDGTAVSLCLWSFARTKIMVSYCVCCLSQSCEDIIKL